MIPRDSTPVFYYDPTMSATRKTKSGMRQSIKSSGQYKASSETDTALRVTRGLAGPSRRFRVVSSLRWLALAGLVISALGCASGGAKPSGGSRADGSTPAIVDQYELSNERLRELDSDLYQLARNVDLLLRDLEQLRKEREVGVLSKELVDTIIEIIVGQVTGYARDKMIENVVEDLARTGLTMTKRLSLALTAVSIAEAILRLKVAVDRYGDRLKEGPQVQDRIEKIQTVVLPEIKNLYLTLDRLRGMPDQLRRYDRELEALLLQARQEHQELYWKVQRYSQ